jgi:hypothetical protein
VWDLNPRGLSTTDLAGLPPTRLGQPRHWLRHYLITVATFLLFIFIKAYAHQNKVAFIEWKRVLGFYVSTILFIPEREH